MAARPGSEIRFGLRENAGQFALLVGVSALVGGMVGQERTIVPLLGVETFGLSTATAALSFLIAFGLTKAVTNLVAGAMADRVGRKPVLVAGWLVGLPVPFLLILAPDWGWVVAANILLGINQGLTWSTTVLMKIDLVGPRNRGLALGLNEAAGYLAVAVVAFLTGLIAESAGLRPAPFFLGIAIAGLGLGASVLFVRETRGHAQLESGIAGGSEADPHWLRLAWRSTVTDRSLSAACQAGLVNNLNDAMAWGLLPIVQAAAGLPIAQIGLLAGAYPATWGIAQVATGALSDRIGRKRLIVAGMLAQALAIAAIAATTGFVPWLARGGPSRSWHGDGLPDADRGRRRCRRAATARRGHRRLPLLAGHRVRGRGDPRRASRGQVRRPGGDPRRRGPDRRLGRDRRRPDAGDAPGALSGHRRPRRLRCGRMSMPATRRPSAAPAPARTRRSAHLPHRSDHQGAPAMEAFRTARPDLDDALDLEAFEAGLHGSIVLPGSPDYDVARQVHSAINDRRPALIVRAADAADVARTVVLARESGLTLSVRGGGHSLAGYGTNDGGIVLDLGAMKGLHIDPDRRSPGRSPA